MFKVSAFTGKLREKGKKAQKTVLLNRTFLWKVTFSFLWFLPCLMFLVLKGKDTTEGPVRKCVQPKLEVRNMD